jgi:hypothetical protein
MENYKPFITKWFVSLIGDQTSLQNIAWYGSFPNLKGEMQRAYCFFHIYTFLDSDLSTLIENRNNFDKTFVWNHGYSPLRISCRDVVCVVSFSFFVCKTVGWVDIGHHFDSFTVATTTWLTAMAYLCHKWPRICSTDMGPFNGKTRILKLSGTTLIT